MASSKTNTRGPVAASRQRETPAQKKRFTWKAPDPYWHSEVAGLYSSFKKSSNFEDFEETDMAMLRILCAELSEFKQNQVEKNASHFKTLMHLLLEFAPTLASRRRLSLEIEKVAEDKKHGELLQDMAEAIMTGKKISGGGV